MERDEEVERTKQMEKMKRWREIKRADPMRLQLYNNLLSVESNCQSSLI